MTDSLTANDPFLRALLQSTTDDPQVIGLVLAGSSAEPQRRDEWSDHDFLMITADGTPETYRTDLAWLPDHEEIGFSFRDTPHGLKALYRTGLLVEFAVFDRAEFASCALNHCAVVLDRGGITDLATTIRSRSLAPAALDRHAALGSFLSLIYVGTGRARRGERLSASAFVRFHAVDHLLRLLRDLLPDGAGPRLDALDPWRRVETALPAAAAALDRALSQPVEQAAHELLELADHELAAAWPDYPAAETELVRRLLGW
jgi:hypothetical protein